MQKNAMYWKWRKMQWNPHVGGKYYINSKKKRVVVRVGVVIQDNLSPEKHINRMFGDNFRRLRNIHMDFNFLGKDIIMRKKIFTRKSMCWNEKEYRKLQLRWCRKWKKIKEMHLTTLKERRESWLDHNI